MKVNIFVRIGLVLVGSLVMFGGAPIALADASGYISALENAGLIDEGGGPCNMINGVCNGRFQSQGQALQTGRDVCNYLAQGRTVASLINQYSHGEGLMPSSYNANVVVNAAIRYLC